jgi:hypothetical protein
MFDKIRILLVDDNPESLQLRDTIDGKDSLLPRIATPELAPYFEVFWLATIEEARSFRDSFLTLSAAAPETLGEYGVVPELLIFDYALSGIDLAVHERNKVGDHGYRKISPLPRLKTALSKLEFNLAELKDPRPRLERLEGESSKTPAAGKGADNYGCFAGGLLLATFFGHPCACVPTTRWGEEKTEGTEAAIFEWLLKRDSGGSFQHKGRTSPRWDDIIKFAIPHLRKRIEQLDDTNLIRLSLDDLFELSEDNPKQIEALRVWSRYGLRRLPIKILFMEMEDGETTATWAQKRLEALLKKAGPGAPLTESKEEIRKGKELAKTLWDIYSSDVLLRRFQLSRLADKGEEGNLLQQEQTAYRSDHAFFGVAKTSGGKGDACTANVYTVKDTGKDLPPRSLRWAVLFTILNLCRRKAIAHSNFHKHTNLRGNSDGLFGNLSAEDVFLALYPSPGGAPSISRPLSSDYARDLIRLKTNDRPASRNDPTNYGNLGLRIGDVLEGRCWSEDAPAKGQWTYGLLPGEKFVLRAYALDIGLTKSDQTPFLEATLM